VTNAQWGIAVDTGSSVSDSIGHGNGNDGTTFCRLPRGRDIAARYPYLINNSAQMRPR
jgi:hypothetical protein